MATVLNFVRGIDLRENNFEGGKFPSKAENLTGLRWINIDRTNVHYLPEELEKMTKLEEISMKHNKLRSLHGELASITTLKQIIASDNHLQNKGIPPQLFRAEKSLDQKVLDNDKREGSDLQVLDLSKNELEEVPKDLECAKDLIVLNLSHNNIDQIRQNLFLEVNGLKYLNLSYNKLDSIPSKCRRLIRLKHLDISNNPLEMAQLRFLPDLTTLTHVNLSNTKRTKSNTPLNFEKLVNLIELNFSENDLVDIPECCFTLKNLKKLNLSLNLIKNLPLHIDSWAKTLEVFNIAGNKINSLPTSFCRFEQLKKVYLNDNEIDFKGIPQGIYKLQNLEYFYASNNKLEILPESLLKCPKLERLILNSNDLQTLPNSIHKCENLKRLDIRNNHKNFEMPRKPTQFDPESESKMYGIDFSLESNMAKLEEEKRKKLEEMAEKNKGAPGRASKRLRDGSGNSMTTQIISNEDKRKDADRVLSGMRDVHGKQNDYANPGPTDAGDGIGIPPPLDGLGDVIPPPPKLGNNWRSNMLKQRENIDYSQIFGDDWETIGTKVGLTVFHIENFYPVKIDQCMFGRFYDGDCYIILSSQYEENSSDFGNENQKNLSHRVYFWIGNESSRDKKTCSAMHAVNLKNMVGSKYTIAREEQNDEDDSFADLFGGQIYYMKGQAVGSGFYEKPAVEYRNRLYVVESNKRLSMYAVPLECGSLNKKHVLILDLGLEIYIWAGTLVPYPKIAKARLVAERINKQERKNLADIIEVKQGYEEHDFWKPFGGINVDELDERNNLESYWILVGVVCFVTFLF